MTKIRITASPELTEDSNDWVLIAGDWIQRFRLEESGFTFKDVPEPLPTKLQAVLRINKNYYHRVGGNTWINDTGLRFTDSELYSWVLNPTTKFEVIFKGVEEE